MSSRFKTLLMFMLTTILMASCVDREYYDLDESDFSSFVRRKKTKQDISTDTPWYSSPGASYVSNECVAWAMMQVFGLDDNTSLNRVRAALCCSFTAYFFNTPTWNYDVYISICNAGGFYPTNVVEASQFLLSNYPRSSYKLIDSFSGNSELGITVGKNKCFPDNKYIIQTTINGKGHFGIATSYRKPLFGKNKSHRLYYKDFYGSHDIALSEVIWVLK